MATAPSRPNPNRRDRSNANHSNVNRPTPPRGAPAQPKSELRTRVEASSRPLLARMHSLPRLVTPGITLVLVVIGAFAPIPFAMVAFALVFLFIGWIAYLSWPVAATTGRLMRLAMLALIVILASTRF